MLASSMSFSSLRVLTHRFWNVCRMYTWQQWTLWSRRDLLSRKICWVWRCAAWVPLKLIWRRIRKRPFWNHSMPGIILHPDRIALVPFLHWSSSVIEGLEDWTFEVGVPYLCFIAHSVLHAGQLALGLHVSSCAQEEMKWHETMLSRSQHSCWSYNEIRGQSLACLA